MASVQYGCRCVARIHVSSLKGLLKSFKGDRTQLHGRFEGLHLELMMGGLTAFFGSRDFSHLARGCMVGSGANSQRLAA